MIFPFSSWIYPLNMVISYSYVNVYQAGYFAPPIPSTPAACWHGSVPCWATPRVFSSTAPLRAADSSPPHWSLVPVEIMEKQREKALKKWWSQAAKIYWLKYVELLTMGGWKTMSFVQGQISDSPASSVHEFCTWNCSWTSCAELFLLCWIAVFIHRKVGELVPWERRVESIQP